MGHSNIWNSHPKNYGPGSRACRVCGNPHAIIRKYGLMCCRQCFRSNAKEIGFIKLLHWFEGLAVIAKAFIWEHQEISYFIALSE
ncbi:40S ribosomal protein S29 [Bienertia sinuspersici]